MAFVHGIPVHGKGVFVVVVALAFLDEEPRFDSPAVVRAQVAALMDMIVAARLAGEPGMARCL